MAESSENAGIALKHCPLVRPNKGPAAYFCEIVGRREKFFEGIKFGIGMEVIWVEWAGAYCGKGGGCLRVSLGS